MLINLIYSSTATDSMNEAELVELLEKAREKNKTLNITGMLLYHDGSFLQVLEGEDTAVHGIYDIIKKDPRHYQVTTIAQRPVKERVFPEWEMGFANLRDVDPKSVEGYSQYLNTRLNSDEVTQNPKFADAFLNAFKTGVMRH